MSTSTCMAQPMPKPKTKMRRPTPVRLVSRSRRDIRTSPAVTMNMPTIGKTL